MSEIYNEKSPVRRLISFSIPIFLTNFLQVFYALTDLAAVGRFVGETGLAAVANGSAVAYLIGSIGLGLAVGGAVAAGHYNGAGNLKGREEAFSSLLALAALTALLITPFGLLFADEIFALMDAPEKARTGAALYFSIVCLGNVFFFLGSALSFSLRSLGDSKSPLYFMLFGGLVNIGLDILLVGGLEMGAGGAALATVGAQAASLLFAVFYLKRRRFRFDFRSLFRPRLAELRRVLRIGLPTMIQLGLINFSYMVISALINGYGLRAAAAAGVGIKICTLAVMPCWAVGQSLTALAANSLGAGKNAEAELLGRAALALSLVVTAIVVAGVQIAARPAMSLFNPGDPGAIEAGVFYLRVCCSLGVVAYAAMYAFNSLAIAAGDGLAAMFNSLLDAVAMRLLVIGLLGLSGFGLMGVYLGQALSAFIPALAGAVYFYGKKWQGRKVI